MQHQSQFADAGGVHDRRAELGRVDAPTIWARVLAVVGTVLVGAPLAAPIVVLVSSLVTGGPPLLDFLMPGEFVAVVVSGAVALVVAAFLVERLRWASSAGLALIATLFGLVGLFSGDSALAFGGPVSVQVVVGAYALYVLAVVAQTVVGVLLCRRAFAGVEHAG